MDIFTTSMNRIFLSTKKDGTFHGACIDTGAQSSVIGKQQAKSNLKNLGLRVKPKHNRRRYRFGNEVFDGLGYIPIRIYISTTQAYRNYTIF